MAKKARQLLEYFKLQEGLEESIDKIIFLNDDLLSQGIVAWNSINVNLDEESEVCDETWESLWDCCDFDINEFSTYMGLNTFQSQEILKRLVLLKYIYPDGSTNKAAYAYVKNISRAMLHKVLPKDNKRNTRGKDE
jgi:hypothetical protein